MAPKRYPSEAVDTSPLGRPLDFTFSGKTAKNRFLKASMSERLASWDPKTPYNCGIPSRELVNIYRQWGRNANFGLILTGNVMLQYDALEAAGNLIITPEHGFEGERFDMYKELAAAAKKDGSLVMAQLNHPGRQVTENFQKEPIAPSAVHLVERPLGFVFNKPRAMEQKDIDDVVDMFAHAAEYCYKTGFDGVQLHGAHGYLLAQFLSKATNKRTDQYGGPISNRARIIFDIIAAIRTRVPDPSFSIGIKVNSVEFEAEGFEPQECRWLVTELEQKAKLDYVELSGGTYKELGFWHRRESTKKREAFFMEFAETVIGELEQMKSYVTGGWRTAGAMVEAMSTVDGVGLARPATHEFDLPEKMLSGEVSSAIQHPISDQDFMMGNLAACAQMYLVGKGKQPLDLSREDHKEVFDKSLQLFFAEMKDNEDGSKYGCIDIVGLDLVPYGEAYPTA